MMTRRTFNSVPCATLLAFGVAAAASLPAHADDQTSAVQMAQAAPAPAAPATPPAAPAAPTSNAMTTPAMTGPLAANPNPLKFDGGPLGPVYVTGVLSGLGMAQTNPVSTDKTFHGDISNGQVIVQTTTGLVQFYAQAGIYSLPALGTAYVTAKNTNSDFFGPLPVGYAKLAPTDSFSIQAGKLPTLIGAEYTFTFQNMNIERGLLWNQEPAISDGVQANYTVGPLAFSVSYNDGFYSGNYNWLTGAATWTIDSSNSLEVVGGGNFGTTSMNTLATPVAQNNSDIFNIIYTYSSAPWTITPYFQYTNVPKNTSLGITHDAQTYGGAVLASYAFTDTFSLAGRAEIIGSTGSTTDGSPSLIFGPGSEAWSLTLTPTYQKSVFFVRGEASYVGASSTSGGLAFGHSGKTNDQERVLAEVGVVF
jgi:Putative beta-barrel porin-2, OmpL-like. bbp2